jgi:23S rRNA pseudouridine1911/1915/1917 synthase
MTATGFTRLVVLPAENGLRLDQFLAAVTRLPRRAARRLIEAGEVHRNQEPTRIQSRILETGDVVDVLKPRSELEARDPLPVDPPSLLYEDRWLLVADKPAGVLSQPAEHRHPTELSFDQVLLLHLAARDGRRPYLRLVHRLDRLTSGAVVCARNPQALPPLTRAWSDGRVDRRYIAVVEGHPKFEATDIYRPIVRDSGQAWRFRTGPQGQPAHTQVRVLDRLSDDLAVLECRLLTGRTHQVRVHLSSIGLSVVGDRLYGARRPTLARRPLLHAAALALPHPHDGRPIRILSCPPDDFAPFLKLDVMTALADALAAPSAQP